jgi:FAD-dependent urate hydroxylase
MVSGFSVIPFSIRIIAQWYNVSRANREYTIRVDDGDEITADHLVVAIGMKAFAFRPPEVAALLPGFVSHTSDLHDLSNFRGKKLVIIGSGQSALECAALLAEENVDVEVLARSRHLPWRPTGHLVRSSAGAGLNGQRSITGALGQARARLRWFVNDPETFRRLPPLVRALMLKRTLRTAASSELKPRLGSVRFALGRRVTAARVKGDRVELHLDDHSTRTVDHVVLGTGYRVDVGAIPFLAPELRYEIRQYNGYPVLNSGMESTVSRLYFIGAAAAGSFGPELWFVRSALEAAERISRALVFDEALHPQKRVAI